MACVTPSIALAVAAVDALVRAGVRHVVLCPGSRSAPLAYALAAREQDGALRLWVRHDERVAAFTALGMGRAGHPAAVVTTSGTAAANLHPAVLEAHHTGVPLVAVTADRPQSLRGTWANQTSELQSTLFGGAVRAHCDLAVAEPAQLAGAITSALGGGGQRPGPVHLDLGFEEPLLPDGELPAAEHRPPPAPVAPSGPVTTLSTDRPTVVVAGDGAGPQARLLAEAAGWPLLAEPSSGARGGGRHDRPLSAAARAGRAHRRDRAGGRLRPADPVPSGDPAAGPPRARAGAGLAVPRLAGTAAPGHPGTRRPGRRAGRRCGRRRLGQPGGGRPVQRRRAPSITCWTANRH